MRLTSTKSMGVNRLKLLIYGRAGVGKTTLASTLPGKTLIVSAESGLLSISKFDIPVFDITIDDDGFSIPISKRFEKLREVLRYLETDEAIKTYDNIFIDSLTEISQNLIEKLQIEIPDSKDTIKMWGEYAKTMKAFVKAFRDLPYYNVIFSALEKEEQDEFKRKFIRINVQGSIGSDLPAFFDEVFYYTSIENKEDATEGRILITQSSSRIVAKDRSGTLNPYEEPNLSLIFKKIQTQQKQKGE